MALLNTTAPVEQADGPRCAVEGGPSAVVRLWDTGTWATIDPDDAWLVPLNEAVASPVPTAGILATAVYGAGALPFGRAVDAGTTLQISVQVMRSVEYETTNGPPGVELRPYLELDRGDGFVVRSVSVAAAEAWETLAASLPIVATGEAIVRLVALGLPGNRCLRPVRNQGPRVWWANLTPPA